MFDKILIANRGEIACRIARTAQRMGVRTVAIYSDADAGALHVDACDEAYRIGPPPARESYLRGDAIIALAKSTGASAIHPGYGFLSENAQFATDVAAAGLVFIGPPPAAIRAMGSKAESKNIMGRAGVPLVPGYHGESQDDALLASEAQKIGYPVLIKASAGGGGKGMRIVERGADFAAALASARREASAAFGDAAMLLEKYLIRPRHIEIQVFADMHGQCVHLFERDCSVQRRHQKVLEEAPAPGMSEERRRTMGETAVAAAKAIGYVGAGTVEFIVDATAGTVDTFHFMEMNTRLQVEHPVTEMITGLDLVEWQLRVAANEPLPLTQDALRITGHAIEARIYAEDAERGFLPSIGRIDHLSTPSASPHVRIDTGVRQGDEISQYYDPMIAKLIVWADDRAEALRHLRGALAAYHVVGVATNVSFLQRVVTHDAFALASVDTGLIARHHAELFPPDLGPTARELAIAALDEFLRLVEDADAATKASADRYSPWSTVQSWWLNSSDRAIDFTFVEEHGSHPVALRLADGGFGVDTKGVSLRATADRGDDVLHVTLDGVYMKASVVIRGQERYLFHAGRMRRLQLADPLASTEDEEHHGGRLTAPMSGSIVAVLVGAGEQVAKGAPLLILEAMKMEHTISAPSAGRVVAVNFAKGDQVREGADLIELDEAEPTP